MSLKHFSTSCSSWLTRQHRVFEHSTRPDTFKSLFHTLPSAGCQAGSAASCTDLQQAFKAEFMQLGLSKAEADKVLTGYPAYLNWSLKERFRPAVAQWRKELGVKDLTAALRGNHRLLSYHPSRLHAVSAWLTGLGIKDSHDFLAKNSMLLHYGLVALRDRAAALPDAGIPSHRIPAVMQKHPRILNMMPGSLQERLRFYADLLGCDFKSERVTEMLLRSTGQSRLLTSSLTTQQDGVAFLKTLGLTSAGLIRSLECNVCTIAPDVLQSRAQNMIDRLEISNAVLSRMLSAEPNLLALQQDEIEANVRATEQLGFSPQELRSMLTNQPALAKIDWSSCENQAKWKYLTSEIGVTTDDCVQYPRLLTSSLEDRLVPRWKFLCELGAIGSLSHSSPRESMCRTITLTDTNLGKRFNRPDKQFMYDQVFIDACKSHFASSCHLVGDQST